MTCPQPPRSRTDDEFSFPQTLVEAARAWRNRMDARLRPLGLSCAMWSVLSCLMDKATPLTQRALAQAVGVEGPTLVRLLDRLEQGGWARRIPDPEDRRIKRVELTEKALPCVEEIRRADGAVRCELLEGIPAADITIVKKVLRAIRDHL